MVEGHRSRSSRRPGTVAARDWCATGDTHRCRAAGEKVAWISLMTVALVSLASRTAGKNSASSRMASSMISWRGLSTSDFDALTTSSM